MENVDAILLRKKIRQLALKRDAYQLCEDGIKKLEEYNKLAAKINWSLTDHFLDPTLREVYPVIFTSNSVIVRESGIYASDIYELTAEIIKLNNQLRTHRQEMANHR